MPEKKKTEQERFLKKKLYDMTLTFDPADVEEEVTRAALVGEFLFYKTNLKGTTDEEGMMEGDAKFPPSQYEEGMASIGGRYYQEMERDEKTGRFVTSLTLPAGVYPYGFVLNYELAEPRTDAPISWENVTTADGGNYSFKDLNPLIPDPKNPQFDPTKAAPFKRSNLYVGTVEDCPDIPAKNPALKGIVSYVTYRDIQDADRLLGVYVPANYDRSKEYPLIFISHGGGGNESEWFALGGVNHIMDNLIAAGKTEEAVVVTMNNTVYDWDFPLIAQNLMQCILPYIQKVYAVTKDPHKMAFCGLSMGGITTLYMYMHHARRIRYFGAFSGGFAGGEGFTLEDPQLAETTLLIGCAEEDIAYNERDIGIPPTIRALQQKKLPYIPYFTPSAHDWFCWTRMFAYFAERVLWK
jgi:pimeloyl-ACP methyl ester carboxylesterase